MYQTNLSPDTIQSTDNQHCHNNYYYYYNATVHDNLNIEPATNVRYSFFCASPDLCRLRCKISTIFVANKRNEMKRLQNTALELITRRLSYLPRDLVRSTAVYQKSNRETVLTTSTTGFYYQLSQLAKGRYAYKIDD